MNRFALSLLLTSLLASGATVADEITDTFGNVDPAVRARLETLKAMRNPPVVEAINLYSAYGSNEFAADKEFKGKYIVVAGIVTNLSKDRRSQQPVVHLNGLRKELYTPQEVLASLFEAQFAEGKDGNPVLVPPTDTAAQIRKGQEALLQCRVTGKQGNYFVGTDQCLVLQVDTPKQRQQ